MVIEEASREKDLPHMVWLPLRARIDSLAIRVIGDSRKRSARLSVYMMDALTPHPDLPSCDYIRVQVEESNSHENVYIEFNEYPFRIYTRSSTRRSRVSPSTSNYRWAEIAISLPSVPLDLLEAAFDRKRMIEICFSSPRPVSLQEAGELEEVAEVALEQPGIVRVVQSEHIKVHSISSVDARPIPLPARLPPELHYVLHTRGRPESDRGTFHNALREMLHQLRCDPTKFGSDRRSVFGSGMAAADWLDQLACGLRTPDYVSSLAPSTVRPVISPEIHSDPEKWAAFLSQQPEKEHHDLIYARSYLWPFAKLPGSEGESNWVRRHLVNPDEDALIACADELIKGQVPYSKTAASALISGLMFKEVLGVKRMLVASERTGFPTATPIRPTPLLGMLTNWPMWARGLGRVFGYGWRAAVAAASWAISNEDYVVAFGVFFALVFLWRQGETRKPESHYSLNTLFPEMHMAYLLTLDGVPATGVLRYAEAMTQRGAVWPPGTLQVLSLMAKHEDSFTRVRPSPGGRAFTPESSVVELTR
jgi:hypothetical protein